MLPYRVQYTESESDITNYNFLYKNTKQVKILSIFLNFWGQFQKSEIFKNSNFHLVLCIRSIIHIWLSIFLIWKISKIQHFQKLNFLFGVMYTFHNSYLYNFSNFYIFIYLYIYIFIQLSNFYIFIYSYIYTFIYLYNYYFLYISINILFIYIHK